MGDVFISYKQEERERMRPIANGLRDLGVDIWFDERLLPDRSFTEEIQHVIQHCRAQLVCWSPAAVASEWVRGEAEKGRQRGVLIAAMIEPCDLPPPFNMHHAENLTGWVGDARHLGWRKICDAIGRKLDRPGLGDLAMLQGSDDAGAWKKWAQKFANDPSADVAWAKAEELEVGAARERMARDRDAAKRLAEELERRRVERAMMPTAPAVANLPPARAVSPRQPGLSPALWGVGFGIISAVAAAGFFVLAQQQKRNEVVAAQNTESSSLSRNSDVTPPTETPVPPVVMGGDSGVLDTSALRSQPGAQAPPRSSATPGPSTAGNARSVLRNFTTAQWLSSSSRGLLEQALAETSRDSLLAASQSEVRAQTLVGVAHLYGAGGFAREPETAARYLRQAAGRGDAQAQAVLGSMFANGRGVARNDQEAVRLLRLSADQGCAAAQHNLAVMFMNGRGVTRDDGEAFRLSAQAANQGHLEAQVLTAFFYENGRGVRADFGEAARYYRMAANQGHGLAQNNLGFLYEEGRGVPRDYDEAVALYRRSAQQNNADGQNNLGRMYKAGFGVSLDQVEAVRYFRLAADQGNAAGRYNLGVMYMNGRGGLSRDTREADRLIRLSAAQGYEPARQAVDAAGVRRDLD